VGGSPILIASSVCHAVPPVRAVWSSLAVMMSMAIASSAYALEREAVEQKLSSAIGPWLGTRYHWGRSDPKAGTDCSGFIQAVARQGFSRELPRTTREQYRMGKAVKRAQLQPGDLVFFDLEDAGIVTHVGVYVGQGRFAHASRRSGVTYDDLGSIYYASHYRGARRVLL
jgi:cell wall-associated NlpC family hydrolase